MPVHDKTSDERVLKAPFSTLDGSLPSPGPRVLLVGPHPEQLRPVIEQLSPSACEEALNFVEAILLLGQESPFDLIVGAVDAEADGADLPRALQHVRAAHGSKKIILLCESFHEPLCRRALRYGADDYLVLPVTASQLAAAAGLPLRAATAPLQAVPSEDAPAAHAGTFGAENLDIDLLALPLVVQAGLMDALLNGAIDLPEKIVYALGSKVQWPGELRLLSPAEAAAAVQNAGGSQRLLAPVEHGGMQFGALELAGAPANAATAARLDQAAAYAGAFLALVKRYEQLRTMAVTDDLSGAYNRRYFNQWIQALLEKAREGRFRVTLLLFDIDNFKSYNDQFGHAAGDSIIREVISLLRHCTRANDLVARIGGDEFAVVFWDSEAPRQPNSQHPRDVLTVTERFRNAIASHEWGRVANVKGAVSISGGLATFPWDGENIDTLMLVADQALMQAKTSGKNVIVLSQRGAAASQADRAALGYPDDQQPTDTDGPT